MAGGGQRLGEGGDDVVGLVAVVDVGRYPERLGDLPTVYTRLDQVAALPLRSAAALAQKLAEQQEIALLSRRLTTVADDAPFSADLDDLVLAGADPVKVDPLFARLGFERIRERITRWG